MKKYDIFISYRRSGGEYTAKIIKDRLEDLGYKVFFDVESLRAGDFNTKLYSVIEECADFLLVLSPGSLDRTENENDWVRLELAHALGKGVNIVPVMLRGFEFPPLLPKDIEAVRFKHGIEANSEFFDAFIQRLSQNLIKSKPKLHNRITQSVLFRRTWPVLLSLAVVAGLIVGGIAVFNTGSDEYPKSQAQKNLADEVLMYMQNNLMAANQIVGEMGDVYDTCDQYLSAGDSLSSQEVTSAINTAYAGIGGIDMAGYAMGASLSDNLNDSPFNKADLQSLNAYIAEMQASLLAELVNVQVMLDDSMAIDKATKTRWMELEKRCVELFANDLVYSTNGLLLPVSDSYLTEFKQTMLPEYTNLPYKDITWQTSEDELKRLAETNYNQLEDVVNEMAQIVGNANLSEMSTETELIEYAISLGFSKTEAEEYVAGILSKSDDITQLKNELSEKKLQLESIRKEAQEKFAPLSTDESVTLWGKMLRFMSLALYEDAKECAQAYYQKVRGDDENADIYMPVVNKFIDQIGDTGIDYGLIVLGYEPGKPPHELYKIGDIIVAVNGQPCYSIEGMQASKKDSGNVVTLLRIDDKGNLTLGDYNLPTGQPMLLFQYLNERDL